MFPSPPSDRSWAPRNPHPVPRLPPPSLTLRLQGFSVGTAPYEFRSSSTQGSSSPTAAPPSGQEARCFFWFAAPSLSFESLPSCDVCMVRDQDQLASAASAAARLRAISAIRSGTSSCPWLSSPASSPRSGK